MLKLHPTFKLLEVAPMIGLGKLLGALLKYDEGYRILPIGSTPAPVLVHIKSLVINSQHTLQGWVAVYHT